MKIMSFLILAIAASSCKIDITDGNAFTGGYSHNKDFGKSGASNSADAQNKIVVKGKYMIRVALHPLGDDEISQVPTLENLQASAKGCICVGAVYLNIKEDFSLEFPNSKAKCSLIGELDLEKLLGGMNDNSDPAKAAEWADKMLRLKKLGPMAFSPSRPLLVGPVTQDIAEFQGLTETKQYNVEYTDPDTNITTSDSGSINVNVLEAGGQLTPLFMPNNPMTSILRFEMRSSGFRKVPRTKGLLFDRVEFTLNTRPINIPVIKLESMASDLMAAAPKDGKTSPMGDSPLFKFFGKFIPVYIRLDATHFDTN